MQLQKDWVNMITPLHTGNETRHSCTL